MNNEIQFDGCVENIIPNPVAETVTLKIVANRRAVHPEDEEKLRQWKNMDEPEVQLVISAPSRPALEFSGDLIAAGIDLGENALIVRVKLPRADVDREDENILADLARFNRKVCIEIRNAQLSLPLDHKVKVEIKSFQGG